MKNLIIGTLGGAFILFIWQFISWGLVNFHYSSNSYLENQDEIYDMLKGKIEPGEYFLPTLPKGSSPEEMDALQTKIAGQPWIQIKYHESFNMNMGMNLFRGFTVDLLAAFLMIWILMKIPGVNMVESIMACVAVGVIGYLTIPYLDSVWFENTTLAYLIDAIVPWVLCGVLFGWLLGRNRS